MEKTKTPAGLGDNLGISNTALPSTALDSTYLDTLFAADPDEVEELPAPDNSTGNEDPTPDAKKTLPADKEPAPRPESFVLDDPDFIEGLAAGDQPQPPASQNTATDRSKAAVQEGDAAPSIPSPGAEAPQSPAGTPVLDHHISDFARELFDTGILTRDEDEEPGAITSPQALVERFDHEKKKGAVQLLENILSGFGPEYREAFDAIYIHGVHPREYFTQSTSVESLAEMDLAKPENQKYVLTQYYKSLGWEGPKITAKIEKLENYQDLEEEARDIHATLLAKEKQALSDIQEQRKADLARKASMEEEYRSSVQRILKEKLKAREIDSIPLDEKTARELSAYMLQKKWQLGEQQISDYEKDILDLTRPEHRELQIKVALLLHLLKTDPTLSRLQRKAITSETNNIFSFLQREQSTARKQGKKTVNFFDD